MVSHSKSTFNKSSHHTTNQTQHKEIQMETLKSVSSGGFTKLSDGKDATQEDVESKLPEEDRSQKDTERSWMSW